jgi:hypothetical protein
VTRRSSDYLGSEFGDVPYQKYLSGMRQLGACELARLRFCGRIDVRKR